MTDELMLNVVRDYAESKIKTAARYLEDFKAKFENDPASAFGWSSDSFKWAGRHSVAKIVLVCLENFKESDIYSVKTPLAQLEIMLKQFKAETMRNAKWPEHSTSPTSNYMSLCMMAARAEWVEYLENSIDRVGSEYKHYLDSQSTVAQVWR
jgi:hypothetical protein